MVEEKNTQQQNTSNPSASGIRRHRRTDTGDPLSLREIKKEVNRVNGIYNGRLMIRRTTLALATVSAVAILVAVLYLPILQIYGNSMTPTLYEGNIVVSIKGAQFEQGDVVSFYYNNNILVKRVMGNAGDWINISDEGVVSVNGIELVEPYVDDLNLGDCNIKLPYQVPEGCIFVMGDHRSTSKDSRDSSMGPIPNEKVVGKIVYRVWPLNKMGAVR